MGMMLHQSSLTLSSRARGTTENVDAIVLFLDSIPFSRVPPYKAEEWLVPITLDRFTAHCVGPATGGAGAHRDIPRSGIRGF